MNVLGYLLEVGSDGVGRIARQEDQSTITYFGNISDYQVNDRVALVCRGSRISAWRDRSGAWTELGFVMDSSYGNAGYLGLVSHDNATAWAISDFGGGAVSCRARSSTSACAGQRL